MSRYPRSPYSKYRRTASLAELYQYFDVPRSTFYRRVKRYKEEVGVLDLRVLESILNFVVWYKEKYE